jgi:hypothetical protein
VADKTDSGMSNSPYSKISALNALKGINPSIFQPDYLTPGEPEETIYYSPPRPELSKFKNLY